MSAEVVEVEPSAGRRKELDSSNVIPVLFVVAVVGVWAMSVRGVDPRGVGDIGLFPSLPILSLAAYVALGGSFLLLFRRERFPMALAWVHIVALAVMLFGLNLMIDDVARINVVWRHIGIAQHIAQVRALDPTIDAYFNWPGFFPLISSMGSLLGLKSPMTLAPAAPIVFNLSYLVPVALMLRTATHDRRVVALALWLFLLGNWVAQDYLAPQALGYFMSLVILAALLQHFSPRSRCDSASRPVVLLVVVVIFGAIVPMHQLTPIALIVCVTLLVAFRQCTVRTLPVIFGLLLLGWLAYGASTYLAGNLRTLLSGVGDLNKVADDNVVSRLGGSPGHQVVTWMRIGVTTCMWLLALIGVWRRRRAGNRDVTPLVLMFGPLLMFGLLSYGGEMVLRVQLFSLPFVSFFAAAAFVSTIRRSGTTDPTPTWTKVDDSADWRFVAGGVVVSIALVMGFLVTRYGNDKFEWFSQGEVDAVSAITRRALPGSRIMAPTGHLPWKSTAYDEYEYGLLRRRVTTGAEVTTREIAAVLSASRNGCGFVILTRSEEAFNDMFGVWPKGALGRLRAALASSSDFKSVVSNRDAELFLFRGDPSIDTLERRCLTR